MENPLQSEFEYYVEHQDELVREHAGKFIVIRDSKVEGVYDTQEEAYRAAREQFDLGTFLIQHVEPGEASYTQTFHSRVA